jgi:hypothetical protein
MPIGGPSRTPIDTANCRPRVRRRSHCCWRPLAKRSYGSGRSGRRSNSRIPWKKRGYRWSDGGDGRPRSWHVDVDETALDDEIAFLRTKIYIRDVEPSVQRLTAYTRFSSRV